MKTGYSEDEAGHIVLTMTRDDLDLILLAPGYFNGRGGSSELYEGLRFLNRILEGSPTFTPYEVPPE